MEQILKYNKEELANTITHGVGLILAVIGSYCLLVKAPNVIKFNAFLWYSYGCLGVYFASTLYHAIPFHWAKIKRFCQKLDHISIFSMIAGTHTPFLFLYLDNSTGRILFWILWGLFIIGTIYKLFFFQKLPMLSLITYIGMGWLGLVTIPLVWSQLPDYVALFILIGGFFYTAGVYFYRKEEMQYHHAIWHLFVMAGSAFHFWAIWLL